jgi:hypothetical protein
MDDYRERFLLVAFTWKGPEKVDELKPLFGTAIDWIRIAANTWVLWTSNDAQLWFTYIHPHLGADDSVFIAELDLSTIHEKFHGWHKKWVWDWFEKHR